MIHKALAAVVCVALLPVVLSACTPRYAVTDLGTLGGEGFTRAEDINASGHVTGLSRIDGTVHHAFVWDGAAMSDLGSTSAGAISVGLGMNDDGVVVGVATAFIGATTTAQVWTTSARMPLVTLGGTENVAMAINNAGIVAGAADLLGDTEFHAVLWNAGEPQDLGTLGGSWSFAQDVNEAGEAVGWSLLDPAKAPHPSLQALAGQWSPYREHDASQAKQVGSFSFPVDMHAFFWDGSTLSDLGTLGGQGSIATALNDSGTVVGMSYIPGDPLVSHAVLWDGSAISDLGTLGGTEAVALDINNSGQIVGMSRTATGDKHAFLYEDDAMIDLNSMLDDSGAGWVLEEAVAINDDGVIAGTGVHSGNSRAFVLTLIGGTSR
jgi:probable HAF family extracellular repeat protein